MRKLLVVLLFLPSAALAEGYHDLGQPDQCGSYGEAGYDRATWFPGGEGGVITLSEPEALSGLNAVIFDGTVTEEGFSDPAGQVLALRAPLLTSDGATEREVVVIMTESGVRVLQACP